MIGKFFFIYAVLQECIYQRKSKAASIHNVCRCIGIQILYGAAIKKLISLYSRICQFFFLIRLAVRAVACFPQPQFNPCRIRHTAPVIVTIHYNTIIYCGANDLCAHILAIYMCTVISLLSRVGIRRFFYRCSRIVCMDFHIISLTAGTLPPVIIVIPLPHPCFFSRMPTINSIQRHRFRSRHFRRKISLCRIPALKNVILFHRDRCCHTLCERFKCPAPANEYVPVKGIHIHKTD